MHPLIANLAKRISTEWLAANFTSATFSSIAAEALVKLAPHRHIDPIAILDEVVDAQFATGSVGSHPSTTVIHLFKGPLFDICLHVWGDNLGEPHSHGWNGAFQVLQGACLHGSFSFREREVIDPRFRLGELRLKNLDVQRPGATVAVIAGQDLIHGQSYVDRPGMSVSVRAPYYGDELTLSYWAPGLAVQSAMADDLHERIKKGFDALYLLDARRCAQALRRALRKSDDRTIFRLLDHAQQKYGERINIAALFEGAARSLGKRARVVLGALHTISLKRSLELRREVATGWDARFLLGALYLSDNRRRLLKVLGQEFGTRFGVRQLGEQLVELASTPWRGGRTLLGTPVDPDLPEILGLMIEDDAESVVLAKLSRTHEPADLRRKKNLIRGAMEGLRGLPLLAPIFR
jgi:hypothetical protein